MAFDENMKVYFELVFIHESHLCDSNTTHGVGFRNSYQRNLLTTENKLSFQFCMISKISVFGSTQRKIYTTLIVREYLYHHVAFVRVS